MLKGTAITLIVVLLLAMLHSDAAAQAASFSAVNWVMAGVLLVDVIACFANGVTLVSASGNRPLGCFGIAAGITSLGLVGLDYALEDNKEIRDDFALAYGVAGTTSLVLGAVNVYRDRPSEDSSWQSQVRIIPYLALDGGSHRQVGICAHVAF